MSKESIIEKLQHISTLETERSKLEQFVETGCYDDTCHSVQGIAIRLKQNSPSSTKTHNAFVELPKIEDIITLKDFFIMLAIGLVAAALFGLIFIPEGKALYFGLITIIAGVLTFKQIKKEKNKEQIIEQRDQQYKKALDEYRQVIAEYKSELDAMTQQLPAYETAYRQAFPKCLQIYSDGEKRKAAAKERLDACTSELNEKNFVGHAYLYLVDDIIHLLQSGRADDYKEALNIAVEEDRQRKMEEARRAEEERRQAEMARQAEEARIRAAVDAKMQADRERSEQRAADEKRKYAGQRRCMSCANRSRCPNDMIARGDGLNCGAYTPR